VVVGLLFEVVYDKLFLHITKRGGEIDERGRNQMEHLDEPF
jgi:hypothetical protein